MIRNTIRLLSVLLTAVAMAAAFAHLLALPNKLLLSREDYFTVQQVYRGWALLGIVIFAALAATVTLAVLERNDRARFRLTATAAACIALSLVVFFGFTSPANQATRNWTAVPENWEELRLRWEYSHAAGAGLYFVALTTLTLSLLPGREQGTSSSEGSGTGRYAIPAGRSSAASV
jgi:hypothetical protein